MSTSQIAPACAVRAEALSVYHGTHPAVTDASFTLPAGQVTAVIGPNGSGKSSLLHAIAGLLPVRSGTLEVLGAAPRLARKSVAYVLQSASVSEALPITVRQVVEMGRYPGLGVFGRRRAADRHAVEAAIERLELTDLVDRQLRELSGGQRQRAFVAQGLAQQADLLLLDEPVTGLDVVSRRTILDAVEAECAAGHTVVMTTHDLSEARQADHVLVLAGRLVGSGPPHDVLVPEVLRNAYGGRMVVFEGSTLLIDDPHHHAVGHDHTVCADDDEAVSGGHAH